MSYVRGFLVNGWLMFSFGMGCLLGLVRWGDPDLTRFVMKLYGVGVRRLGGIRTKGIDIHNMTVVQPAVYACNHQSALDMGVIGQFYPPRTVGVVKKEVLWFPVLGLFFLAGRSVVVDRGNREKAVKSLEVAAQRIKEEGISIGIFPEGTRNRKLDEIKPFKKGAFHLAVQAQIPIVPIIVSSYRKVGTVEKFRIFGGEITVRVLDPIPTKGLVAKDVPALAQAVHDRMQTVFEEISWGNKKLP